MKKKSAKTKKVASKAELKKTIELKVETALSSMKTDLGEKKFMQLVKKAGKLFSSAVPQVTKAKKIKKEKTAKIPAMKK